MKKHIKIIKDSRGFSIKVKYSRGNVTVSCMPHTFFCGGLLVCRRARTEPAHRRMCTLVNGLHLQGVSEAATSQSTLEVCCFLLETEENKHKQIFNRELSFVHTLTYRRGEESENYL